MRDIPYGAHGTDDALEHRGRISRGDSFLGVVVG